MSGEQFPPTPAPSPRRRTGEAAPPLRSPEGEEPEGPAGGGVVRGAPPWLVSLLVHCLLLLILALLAIQSDPSLMIRLNARYSEKIGEQLIDDSVSLDAEEPVEEEIEQEIFVPTEEPEVEDPIASTQPEESPTETLGPRSVVAAPIGSALDGRDPGSRQALLEAFGGDARTEEAVEAALRWLANKQFRNGSWSMTGRYADGGMSENVPAATAMALLAFQGAGNTHLGGKYRNNVSRGWVALLKYQTRDGDFFDSLPRSQRVENQRMYTNALCTIALCELYGMTEDSYFYEPAQRAVDYLVRNQSREGGWRYQAKKDSDLSVTGWCMMALQSARMAGIVPPEIAFREIEKFLDDIAFDDGARYFYRKASQATEAMTAEGLLCRQYLGWTPYDERLRRGVEYLLANPIDYDKANVYYWYYATQVLHHFEGDAWRTWNAKMKATLPAMQVKKGRETGSWDPFDDRWGQNRGGRLYVTCLSTYMLEVYYRHLPIYRVPDEFAAN